MHKEFEVHMLNDVGKQQAGFLAEEFDALLSAVEKRCAFTGSERYMAIVRTKLEEACFFAKKAMVQNTAYTNERHSMGV